MGYVLLTACGRHLWYSSYEMSEEGNLGWSTIGPRLDLGEQVRRAVRELSIVKATIADHQSGEGLGGMASAYLKYPTSP